MSGLSRYFTGALTALRRRLDEPLLVATLAAIAGILLADARLFHPLSAAVAIGLGGLFFLQSRRRGFLLLAIVGTFALAHHHRLSLAQSLPFAAQLQAGESLPVEVEGVIDTVPKVSADRAGKVTFFLRVSHLRQLGGRQVATSRRLHVSATADPPPDYGDRVRLSGQLRAPRAPRNPGEFDFGKFLERKGVIAQLSAGSRTGLQVVGTGEGNPFIAAANRARRWVAATITHDLKNRDPEVGGVLTSMTLGSRDDARDEIIDSFRTSGTLHIFAVSGLHVGLIGIILWQLLTPMPVNRRARALIIILTLCGYAFVTGLRPSAVRATIMASLVLAGPLFDREPRVINSLGAAGFAILAFDSNQLFLPGFQLSFAVLLALTLLHKPILSLLLPFVSHDPFLPESLLTTRQRSFYKATRALAETFAVSVAAWIGSLPLMLYHFHLATPIAPIANLFLIPIAFCVLGTAILSTLTGALGLATLCAILNNANFVWAGMLTATAGWFADLPVPASHFYATRPAVLRPPCEITVLDLPRGGASTLIATRGGADWLVDTGNARDFRPTVAAALHAHAGVTHIDRLLLTHPDAAHIGGAGEVIATLRPTEVFTPHPNRSSSAYRKLASLLDADRHRAARPFRPGETLRIDRDRSIEILYAPSPGENPRLSDDTCIVFLLQADGWRILFTGDAGFSTEERLLRLDPERLRADLIIRGHHNADHSLTPEFLDAVRPRCIIASARNHENLSPDQEIWQRAVAERGIRLFDQSETGAVCVELHPDRLEVTSFLTVQSMIVRPSPSR